MGEDEPRLRSSTRVYCRDTTDDGRVCSLYKDHYGPVHKENHGKSTWPVVEKEKKQDG